MPLLYLFVAFVLSACTASVTQQNEPLDIVRELVFTDAPEVQLEIAESGSTFLGRFASSSALNSKRSFVSDFHGEVRVTLYKNNIVECRWWAEGRVSDPTVYDEANGFIEAYSTLCTGKLQRDGSFEFQGAYISDGPEHESEDALTFTLSAKASKEIIQGSLLIGGVLGTTDTLVEPSAVLDAGKGVMFEAVLE